MLDRSKLFALLTGISDRLFSGDDERQAAIAQEQWRIIAADPTFAGRAADGESSFLVPRWRGNLADTAAVPPVDHGYAVLGVDGSQIYPDRHLTGVGCFLVNAGGCLLRYGKESSAELFSEPRLLMPDQILGDRDAGLFSPDLVDLVREAYEFEVACQRVGDYRKNESVGGGRLSSQGRHQFLLFLDGSLVFWYLEGKLPEVRDYFLQKYVNYLQELYEVNVVTAGYISMPKSRELINLIRLGLCRFDRANCIGCHSNYTTFPCRAVDEVTDASLCRHLLPVGTRTTIFESTSKITEQYPRHLRPCFWYLNVGAEVVRLEAPAWVADDPDAVKFVSQVALDQAAKGYGYPVVLAESHEQAVVHAADRDFFYHLLSKRSLEHQRRLVMSPKSIKKKGMGF